MSESGESDGEGGTTTPAVAAVEPPTESVALDSDVKIEVDFLTLNAARSVMTDIAAEVASLEPSVVVIGGDGLLTAARAFNAYQGRIKLLGDELKSVLAQPESPTKKGTTESLVAQLSAATSVVSGVATLLSYFKAQTTYTGKKIELSENALYPLLAGQLAAKSVGVVLPELFSGMMSDTSPTHSVMGMLDELRRLRDRVRAKYPAEPPPSVAALFVSTDAAIEAAVKVDPETGKGSMTQLLLGSDMCRLIEDEDKPLFVSIKSISAGGNSKSRKHLFTTLFTGDKLSYTGGAAIGYFVFDLKTSKLVKSDVCMQMGQSAPSSSSCRI
ncbi:hypothetical protein FJV76_08740 [Mesorhizobium sp. WSM4303]|uniref:hypothetical protein n=1 Tax=unclassified Mesorhizobium TaxID=325217 RepID=UPI00115DDB89|nr:MULTISPECIES: hypothetical protein [unclassified Mesorhizobium]TRC99704.1 hypothetical protein FJV77_04610 [Mesorhizobium sp. WSM4306]TRD05956.1 hypothetical protein FJV76_08740 [Mesorhizobium sp. WSM4303]